MSRLVFPHLLDLDYKIPKSRNFPPKLKGSHSLEAWGHRLGRHKGDYKKEMEAKGIDPWANWNPDMQGYCENDVEVTYLLWVKLQAKVVERALGLETWFAYILTKQEHFGYAFHKKKAVELYQTLFAHREAIDKKLLKVFKPRYISKGTIHTENQ